MRSRLSINYATANSRPPLNRAALKTPPVLPTGGIFIFCLCQMPPSSIRTMIRLNGTPSNQSRIGIVDLLCVCALFGGDADGAGPVAFGIGQIPFAIA